MPKLASLGFIARNNGAAKAIKKAANQMKKIEAKQAAKKTGKGGRPKRM